MTPSASPYFAPARKLAKAVDGRRNNGRQKGVPAKQTIPLDVRFERYSRQNGECVEWTGARDHKGYGRIEFLGRTLSAHRVNYERLRGPIPKGLVIDHLCRNPSCINPDHLEPVTNGENVLRGVGITAVNISKTHCPHGHEYAGKNLIRRKSGARRCRECSRISDKKRRSKVRP